MTKSTDKPKRRPPIDYGSMVQSIFDLMANGEVDSLRHACRKHNIRADGFLDYVNKDKDLAVQYARAHDQLVDHQAEQLIEIGHQAANASTVVEVAGLRLLSDNKKWLLSKVASRRYGDKLDVTSDNKRLEFAPILIPMLGSNNT
jgi:hypothetical protein